MGVRKNEVANVTPSDWESHSLSSLSRLEATEQAQLALHLEKLGLKEGESVDDQKLRNKARYTDRTLGMLTYAKKHWCRQVDLSIVHLNKNGSIFERFTRFKERSSSGI